MSRRGGSRGKRKRGKKNGFEILKSGCCHALVRDKGKEFPFAVCLKCDNEVRWGFLIPDWAARESCAVVEDFEGKKWFAWHIVSSLVVAQECIKSGQQFVCAVKNNLDSVTAQRGRDGDMIPLSQHREFTSHYLTMYKMGNPEAVRGLFGVSPI